MALGWRKAARQIRSIMTRVSALLGTVSDHDGQRSANGTNHKEETQRAALRQRCSCMIFNLGPGQVDDVACLDESLTGAVSDGSSVEQVELACEPATGWSVRDSEPKASRGGWQCAPSESTRRLPTYYLCCWSASHCRVCT